MAQAQSASGRSTPEVEAWVRQTMDLISAAGDYAEAGTYDAATDGMIRRIRVIVGALSAAINGIQFPRVPPPDPGPPPAPPEA